MKRNLITITMAVCLLIAPISTSYAWWGSNSYSTQDTSYDGRSYGLDEFKTMQGYKDTTPALEQKSFWSNVGDFLSKVGSAISTAITKTWDFTKSIASSIKDIFVKSPDIKQVDTSSQAVRVSNDSPQFEKTEATTLTNDQIEQTNTEATKQETEVKATDAIESVKADVVDSAEGKVAELEQDVTVQQLRNAEHLNIVDTRTEPELPDNIQMAMTGQNVHREDMVSFRALKSMQQEDPTYRVYPSLHTQEGTLTDKYAIVKNIDAAFNPTGKESSKVSLGDRAEHGSHLLKKYAVGKVAAFVGSVMGAVLTAADTVISMVTGENSDTTLFDNLNEAFYPDYNSQTNYDSKSVYSVYEQFKQYLSEGHIVASHYSVKECKPDSNIMNAVAKTTNALISEIPIIGSMDFGNPEPGDYTHTVVLKVIDNYGHINQVQMVFNYGQQQKIGNDYTYGVKNAIVKFYKHKYKHLQYMNSSNVAYSEFKKEPGL